MSEFKDWAMITMTAILVIIELFKSWPRNGKGKHRKD
jgi:hypothetical protein